MLPMDNKMVSTYFTCQTCNAIFTCLNFFQQHRKEHAQSDGVTLFTCAHCPFVSDNNFNFNWHNMTHTKGQEHKCEICAPSEVSTNTWSNPFDIDSDSISTIDCSRFGKRSIATQYYDEDVDANAAPYPLTGELDYDDEATEEDDDDPETEEDDAATQIEDEHESYLTQNNHQDGYDGIEDEYISEEFNTSTQNGEDYPQITDESFHQGITESYVEEEGEEERETHDDQSHHSDKRFAQQDDCAIIEGARKRKSSRKRSKKKTKTESKNNDVYDFKSDDDAQFDSHSLPTTTRTPSRSSSSLSHPQIHQNNGQILVSNGASEQQGMLVVSSHSGQVNHNGTLHATQAPTPQPVQGSQANTQPTTQHLLQPAQNSGAFLHAGIHGHMHSGQDGQNPPGGHPIQAFQMTQQFFLPQPGPFGAVSGQQQHPQFIGNSTQFQPGGQIQLVSIPANMQQQNPQFMPPPSQQNPTHNLPPSQSHLTIPSQPQSQLNQGQQTQCVDEPMKLDSSTPVVVKAKKSKSKPAVLLPSPSSNNRQNDSGQSVKQEITETPSTPSSPVKPKGHGKGNRKPRINFVSLGNGITIGSDGIRRKFHCSLCGNGKSFKTKSHLQRHMLTHTGEKPYQCNDCGSKFNQSSSLRNHMIAIHTKQFPHSCQVCGKGFLMPAVLQRHIQQTGHIADEESCQENSNGSNAISTNENISTFNNVITPIRADSYYQPTFNNPSNVMMTYYAPT